MSRWIWETEAYVHVPDEGGRLRWAASGTLLLGIVFAVVVLCCVGCVSDAAIHQAKTEQVVNRAHANDQGLPGPARLIAEDNYDAWSAQLYNLTGTRLPADVVRRLQRRGTLPDGYEGGE